MPESVNVVVCATAMRAAEQHRARMILLSTEGLPGRLIAERVGVSAETVSKWRKRFEQFRVAGAVFRDDLVVGVECMHCWYWISDLCEEYGIQFFLGHALYMKAIHCGKTKNDRIDSFKIAMVMRGGNFSLAYVYPKEMRATRDLLRRRTRMVRRGAMLKAHAVNTLGQYNLPPSKVYLNNPGGRSQLAAAFTDPDVQRNIDLDLAIVDCYQHELKKLEWHLEQQAKLHDPASLNVLKTIPGVGRILALTILYEVGDIQRFESVQKFASYARLVKCKAESAGKVYGTQGNKIGNAQLKRLCENSLLSWQNNRDMARGYFL